MLPLLEFALSELWARQVDKTLTHSAYERIGQLSGAIANRAESFIAVFLQGSKKLSAIFSLG
jgi:hypothetical protein